MLVGILCTHTGSDVTRYLIKKGECLLYCSHGSWIVDGFPVNKDQWSLLLERGRNLPDHVIFLYDESPNGDLLIKRWYAANRANVDEQTDRYSRAWLSMAVSDEVAVLK